MTSTDPYLNLDTALADLPGRIRVHELAKRAGTSSKVMIAALAGAGVNVASASSSVDRETAAAVLTALLGSEPDVPRPSDEPPTAEVVGAEVAEGEQAGPGADGIPALSGDDGRPARRRRGRGGRGRGRSGTSRDGDSDTATADGQPADGVAPGSRTEAAVPDGARPGAGDPEAPSVPDDAPTSDGVTNGGESGDAGGGDEGRRRRRRGRRGRGRPADGSDEPGSDGASTEPTSGGADDSAPDSDASDETSAAAEPGETGPASALRRRRRRRGSGSGSDATPKDDDPDQTVVHVREPRPAGGDVVGVRGSTRLEAKRQRRKDTRDSRRRPQILSEAEFLARRESVERVMAIRQRGDLAQVALLEDGVLVEHFVSRTGSESMMGNVYLGKVQNVLPSMEAAFVDIGRGRNAVLYAGEVNWDMAGLVGKARRIETALSSGDTILVQVSKDPVGHKGARLTSQVSLPGRFLVYVPGGGATGISRKLPDTERRRLKAILDKIVPEGAGVIIRTAAEGVDEAELIRDVERLREQWEQIEAAATKKSSAPAQLYGEPGTLIKVIRDLFNSDINSLVVDGDDAWSAVSEYVLSVAPELAPRVGRYAGDGDIFGYYRVDEQIAKALERKVHLPSGGSLVIDRTEAMTVVDVNTGKFTGSGGNLEETVTRNNLEAAEEIVRQLRLRDIGGIIVVDFIDMVLESNRELVLRRLTESLGRDRTRHQVAEVTSLGLVQMTRKRMGIGLVEAFSEPCPHCGGRGIVLHDAPVAGGAGGSDAEGGERRNRRRGRAAAEEPVKIEPLLVERVVPDVKPDPRGPRPPAAFRPIGSSAGEGAQSEQELPVVSADAAERPAPAQPPSTDPGGAAPEKPTSRRRRAAGRPAGAPTAVTEALDLVIPSGLPRAAEPSMPDGTTDAPGTAGVGSGEAPADDSAGGAAGTPPEPPTASRRRGGAPGSRTRSGASAGRARRGVNGVPTGSEDAAATNGSADAAGSAAIGSDGAVGTSAGDAGMDEGIAEGATPADTPILAGAPAKRSRSRRGR